MFTDVEDLRTAILNQELSEFVSYHMFEPIPFAFEADFSLWIAWKTELAGLLEVDPRDVVIIGSAAIGFSLNPHKCFKPFDSTSDIDCGIISPYHFDIAWRCLRQMRPEWLSLPEINKRAIEIHRKTLVFAGTIATDRVLGILPFGSQWQKALTQMGRKNPTTEKDVNIRIYRDFESLRSYQINGLRRLRDELSLGPKQESASVIKTQV